jgi:hypothetical protein
VIFLAAQTTTNSTTALWFTLLGALGGVLLTGTFALTTAILNHRWQERAARDQAQLERSKKYREERQAAYAEFMLTYGVPRTTLYHLNREVLKRKADGNNVDPSNSELGEILGEANLAWRKAAATAQIVAGPAVKDDLDSFIRAMRIAIDDTWNGEFESKKHTDVLSEQYSKMLSTIRNDLAGTTE